MHIYYLETIDTKEYDLLGTIYIIPDELDKSQTEYDNKSIFGHEPAELTDSVMDLYGIVATGTLIKNWIRGRLYFSCCNVAVTPEHKGKGFGKLLYKSMLRGIEHHTACLKTKPLLAQHSIIEGVPLTTDEANNVYNSLIRTGELIFHKGVLFGEGFLKDDLWHVSEYKDTDFRGNIFKIKRYPIMGKFYVNNVFITQLGTENLPPLEFKLWEFIPADDTIFPQIS